MGESSQHYVDFEVWGLIRLLFQHWPGVKDLEVWWRWFGDSFLSTKLWQRGAKHWVVSQCFPRHQKCVLKRDLCQSLLVTCLVLSPAEEKHQLCSSAENETHKCRLVSTCALVTTCAKPEPPPSCPAAVTRETRTGLRTPPWGRDYQDWLVFLHILYLFYHVPVLAVTSSSSAFLC